MKAKHTPPIANISFSVSSSAASVRWQMNLNTSCANFPVIDERVRNGRHDTFGNLSTPDLWQQPLYFLFYKQKPIAGNCFVEVEYRGVNGVFASCCDRFVDD